MARAGSTPTASRGQRRRIGVWLVGARGTLATTVVAGARALARGLVGRWGLVTELPELRPLRLVGPEGAVTGL